jgi:tRNA(Leu) C34 or U34 (ribose-2'-O)-methylase TrmL
MSSRCWRRERALNVATAGGMVIYESLRKCRELERPRYLDCS